MSILKDKRIWITLVLIALLVGVLAGVFAYKKSTLRAEVFMVSDIRDYWWGSDITSQGMVTNDHSQIIRLPANSTIKEIFVEEGQEVKAGDKLLELDVEVAEIQLKIKELEVENIKNQIAITENDLKKWRNTTPGSPDPEPITPDLGPEKEKETYRYISSNAIPYNATVADGTPGNPYRYLCTPDAFVFGEVLENIATSNQCVIFEIREGGNVTGDLINSWEIVGSQMAVPDAGSFWSVADKRPVFPYDSGDVDINFEVTYTAEEIRNKIRECEESIKSLDLTKRKAELELQTIKASGHDGIVVANIDGVIKNLQVADDNGNLPDSMAPLMEVAGSSGLYVTGSVSELLLDQIEAGQEISVNSWESGTMTTATITEITYYPSGDENYYGGDNNPNVSQYPYTAYIEDTSGLRNGEYVDLSMTLTGGSSEEQIYLPNAYIRSENGKSYVLKENENGRLEKVYIETGSILYGQSTQIKSGLTLEDKVAFPYGKTAKEGIKTLESSSEGYEVY